MRTDRRTDVRIATLPNTPSIGGNIQLQQCYSAVHFITITKCVIANTPVCRCEVNHSFINAKLLPAIYTKRSAYILGSRGKYELNDRKNGAFITTTAYIHLRRFTSCLARFANPPRCTVIRNAFVVLRILLAEPRLESRAFQFGQRKFRFDSIRFGNLINLPLVH